MLTSIIRKVLIGNVPLRSVAKMNLEKPRLKKNMLGNMVS